MPLAAGCPRCPTPVAPLGRDDLYTCPDHGTVAPLWRPEEATYDDFVAHLERGDGLPTYVPWPLGPGWRVTDFGAVASRAAYTCVSGTSELDGPVDVLVVTEETGVGLGARWAGTAYDDPGHEIASAGQPVLKLPVEGQTVRLWSVTSGDGSTNGEWDRSVAVGEAGGRWLWLVIRPASALLMLRDDWRLRDVSRLGPALVELPFGGPRPW